MALTQPNSNDTVHVLQAPADVFETMAAKQKLPKPKLTPAIAKLGMQILERRLRQYPEVIIKGRRLGGRGCRGGQAYKVQQRLK